MSISDRDCSFMGDVTEYFRGTITPEQPEGSIRRTAKHFNLARAKVRKILITEGVLKSELTDQLVFMRKQGKSIGEIAGETGLSKSTISTYLPYGDIIGNSLDPSKHAKEVRMYRAYERKQIAQIEKLKEEITDETPAWQKDWAQEMKMSFRENPTRRHRFSWAEAMRELKDDDESGEVLARLIGKDWRYSNKTVLRKRIGELAAKGHLKDEEEAELIDLQRWSGEMPGALWFRNQLDLELLYGKSMQFEPLSVIRLHLELFDTIDAEDIEALRRFGGVTEGDSISRDIIVPSDLPLYALHFVIQRLFGWNNEHRHIFTIPADRVRDITNDNAAAWSCMVGLVFRSPFMGKADITWADDYIGGSVKNWMRKKYTGPYLSRCLGESYVRCQGDMMMLDSECKRKVRIIYRRSEDGSEVISKVWFDVDGNVGLESNELPSKGDRIEFLDLWEVPIDALRKIFNMDKLALLERLPLWSVLASGIDRIPQKCSERELDELEGFISDGNQIISESWDKINKLVQEQDNRSQMQPNPPPFTDVLFYEYGCGKTWRIKITASLNCVDLVEEHKITQIELDRGHIKCRELYRPVLVYQNGKAPFEYAEDLKGYIEYLRELHPDMSGMTNEECKMAEKKKQQRIELTISLDRKKEKHVSISNLL